MKFKYYLYVLAFALVAIPSFAMLRTTAQAVELTNTQLEDLIEDLTDRVDALEEELEDATTTIAKLEKQITDLKSASTEDDEDADTDEDDDDDSVTDKTTGNGVAVCHNGKTQYVNVHSALTYKSQGATIGVCTQERVKKQGTDDDEEDEDEEEDDTEDTDDEDDE